MDCPLLPPETADMIPVPPSIPLLFDERPLVIPVDIPVPPLLLDPLVSSGCV